MFSFFFLLFSSDHWITAFFEWLTALNYLVYKVFPLWQYYSFSGSFFCPITSPKASMLVRFCPRDRTNMQDGENKLRSVKLISLFSPLCWYPSSFHLALAAAMKYAWAVPGAHSHSAQVKGGGGWQWCSHLKWKIIRKGDAHTRLNPHPPHI